jgi:hypothetical protein
MPARARPLKGREFKSAAAAAIREKRKQNASTMEAQCNKMEGDFHHTKPILSPTTIQSFISSSSSN